MSAHRQYVPAVAAAFRFIHAPLAAGGFIINDAVAPDKPHKVECFGRRVKGGRASRGLAAFNQILPSLCPARAVSDDVTLALCGGFIRPDIHGEQPPLLV